MPRASIVETNRDTIMLRQVIEAKLDAGETMVTYAEAAAALNKQSDDRGLRETLRRQCEWASRHRDCVSWVNEPNIGYRIARPEEAADILGSARRWSVRKVRRTIVKAGRATQGATLSEHDQARLYVEMAAATAMVKVGDAHAIKRISGAVNGAELPSAEVLKLFVR